MTLNEAINRSPSKKAYFLNGLGQRVIRDSSGRAWVEYHGAKRDAIDGWLTDDQGKRLHRVSEADSEYWTPLGGYDRGQEKQSSHERADIEIKNFHKSENKTLGSDKLENPIVHVISR